MNRRQFIQTAIGSFLARFFPVKPSLRDGLVGVWKLEESSYLKGNPSVDCALSGVDFSPCAFYENTYDSAGNFVDISMIAYTKDGIHWHSVGGLDYPADFET